MTRATGCIKASTHLKTAIAFPLSLRPELDLHTTRFLSLGYAVLLQDIYGTFALNGDSVFLDLIPQFGVVNCAVSQAIAAFGAIYDTVFVLRSQHGLSRASAQYINALSALNSDITARPQGLIPAFFASVILAAAQVLLQHYTDSLAHLQGAFTLLHHCRSTTSDANSGSSGTKSITNQLACEKTTEDRLHIFAQSIDLQTAWYVLHRPPDLPGSFEPNMLREPSCMDSLQDASIVLQSLLHHCYHVANQATNFKYRHSSEHPNSLVCDQGKCIAYLSQWMAKCDIEIKNWTETGALKQSRNWYLILRVQCLSTLIYLSTILSPYEITYDTYAIYFRQIVQGAGEVLSDHLQSAPANSYVPFRLQPGLAQALFLTSLKHRHPIERRNAIDLLSMTGVEGPWNSSILCRVARRAVEIEESRSSSSLSMHVEDLVNDKSWISVRRDSDITIPEHHRLHGCSMSSEAGNFEANKPSLVHFSLCNGVEQMVQSRNFESPEHWNIWAESVAISHPFSM